MTKLSYLTTICGLIELDNVLFVDQTLDIKNDYENTLKHAFLTEVRKVDYSNGRKVKRLSMTGLQTRPTT